eukprot:3942765-Pleurochrysis_carterae.AAC.2
MFWPPALSPPSPRRLPLSRLRRRPSAAPPPDRGRRCLASAHRHWRRTAGPPASPASATRKWAVWLRKSRRHEIAPLWSVHACVRASVHLFACLSGT